ncbi:LOW QUALITY PROTEIN: phospholipid-transporting ATPase ABCA3-like [Centruroides vittatus]|uniref:LOW QUALITY PROTEIN: phospholipid-transporting ATPase ABCA3-like n=1 Tax=Centruroides vittatus TaxID=120091 RepID=UPI0035106358
MGCFRSLQALLWKSWIIHRRHFIWTIIELILPLLCSFTLVYIASKISFAPQNPDSDHKDVTVYNGYNLKRYLFLPNGEFLYTPNEPNVSELLQYALRNGFFYKIKLKGFNSEEDMEAYAKVTERILGAAVFEEYDKESLLFKYKLRLPNKFTFETDKTYYISSQSGPRLHKDYYGGYALSTYLKSNFLGIQASIDLAYIDSFQNISKDINLYTRCMLYPPYEKKGRVFTISDLIPQMLVYGFIVFIPLMVKRIVDEKANRAKEMMKLMGMSNFTYWGSVFLVNFIFMAVISLLVTMLYSIEFVSGRSVIANTSVSLFFIFLLFYSAAAIIFCFVLTTVCNKASISVILSIIIWAISFSVPSFLITPIGKYDYFYTLSLSEKLLSCLLPNMALQWGIKIISLYNAYNSGLHWDKLFSSPLKGGDGFCFAHVICMMIVCCLFYSILLWYLDSVWPWQPGVPKPFYFCFCPSYWCSSYQKLQVYDSERFRSSYFEEEPRNFSPTVVISHLSKKFKSGMVEKIAVNDMSLNLYHGQITALLGHNGAGKTTTMSILTGMFPPSSGYVTINNYDIVTSTTEARRSVGLCPQHNVLYDSLTVEQHLKFFGLLKNMSWSDVNTEATKILNTLHLRDKRNCLAKDLSGGMKRKLSLGIAIIGKSKVLILDEPTSGMDPEARRLIWDLLLEIRQTCTILLSTHYMEEADALGDRIAIMADGSLKCCGSSIFLKRKFGTGYHLHISKGSSCNVEEVTNIIQSHIPEASVLSNLNQELIYSLSSQPKLFVALFEKLENSFLQLGILSCGVSVTTMEDVFLKVGKISQNNCEEMLNNDESESFVDLDKNKDIKLLCSSKSTGLKLLIQQMKSIIIKRFHYAKRDWIIIIFQLAIPLILFSFMIWLDSTFYVKKNENALDLNLEKLYSKTNAFYKINTEIENNSLTNIYKNILESEDATVFKTDNVFEYQLNHSKHYKSYTENDLVGATLEQNNSSVNITSWFNGVPYHLDPISLNLVTSSILRYATNNNQSNIQIINHPLPGSLANSNDVLFTQFKSTLLYVVFTCLALTFLSSSFVLFLIHERITKAKLLQRMCGLNGCLYWFTNFIWDYLLYILCSFILIIPFLVYSSTSKVIEVESIGAIFLVFVLHGWAILPLVYILSFFPKQPSTGFALLVVFCILTGMILGIILVVLVNTQVMSADDLDTTLWVTRFFPNFAATWSISGIHNISVYNTMCDQLDSVMLKFVCESPSRIDLLQCCQSNICKDKCHKRVSYLSWEATTGKDLMFLAIDGLLYFSILIFIETFLPKLWYKFTKVLKQKYKPRMRNIIVPANEDSDVLSERNRINILQKSQLTEEAMIVRNLTKNFKSFCAVNNLTFSVHKEECFGLLGINGAGKTTTFRMLTGDLMPSEGNAYIDDYNIKENIEKFQKALGYCPQFDALINRLTGREMLVLFANLRGIHKNNVNLLVKRIIEMCDLEKHANKVTETYSGGTKRKLSLGLALIGLPSIILLDEPTSGLDPISRRKIWKTLIIMRQLLDVSFVLTSHGMDECETLCNRIAIMVNGQFRCLGAMQHLRAKYGQGFTLIVKVKRSSSEERIANVKRFIESSFPSAVLKDAHQDILHYHVTDPAIKWSKMFSLMENAKEEFQLEDYLISGTTLEQIFLAFAKAQIENC